MNCTPGLQDAQRVFDEGADLVQVRAVVVAHVAVGAIDRIAQLQRQVLGWAALNDILDLVEELALFTFASAGIYVVAIDISGFPEQTRNAVATEVQFIASLPGALVLGVEVRIVGVGDPDGAAAIADVVAIVAVPGYTLVRQDEGMCAGRILSRQAPDSGVFGFTKGFFVVLVVVDVEIKCERLITTERQYIIEVRILLLGDIFVVSVIQRCAQVFIESVAAADDIDARRLQELSATRLLN